MLNRLKNFFKLNNWKRWTILILSFGFISLFVGLSFSFKSKETKLSSDYNNSVVMVIDPKNMNGGQIDDQAYSRQLLYNLKNRLQNEYPNSVIETSFEDNNVWNVNATNIADKKQFLNFVTKKESLTLVPISFKTNDYFFQGTSHNNDFFNKINLESNTLSAVVTNEYANSFYNWVRTNFRNDSKVIIWKNIDILKKIMEQENYYGSFYDFLFVGGYTPEMKEEANNNSSGDSNSQTYEIGNTTRNPIFKEEFVYENKKYKATDFIVSKNTLDDFKNTSKITFSKDFGAFNYQSDYKEVQDEFYDFSFWVADYNLNNCSIIPMQPNNGTGSQFFLLISMVSFFAIISIFVVINYGYLGLLAVFILAIIIFLSLLMITVFFGDYDSVTISSILVSAFISLEFIISFLDKIKRYFLNGNSVSKSTKLTIKKMKTSLFIRSLLLVVTVCAFFGLISTVTNEFSIIVLITCFAIPIILIPLMILLTNIMVGIKQFENNPRLITFGKRNYKNEIRNDKDESISEELGLNDTLQANISKDTNSVVSAYKINQWEKFVRFKRFTDKKSLLIILSVISYVLIFGLVIFLVSFFVNGKTLKSGFHNISPADKQQIVLRISKTDNNSFTSSDVNGITSVVEEFGISNDRILVQEKENLGLIEVYIDSDFSAEKLNQLVTKIYSLYDVIVISSQMVESNTFKVMQYTLFAALLAIIAMCIFVLIWMKWSQALSLLLVSLLSFVSFIFAVAFGLIQINVLLLAAALFNIIILLLSATNIMTKIHHKLKVTRIEELTTEEIKDLVYKQVFKSLKSLFIVNGIMVGAFALFLVCLNSLPLFFLLFMMGITIMNFIYVVFLLPKLIIIFESKRAKLKRKVILENYWDTEKIKEQTFNGINNIK